MSCRMVTSCRTCALGSSKCVPTESSARHGGDASCIGSFPTIRECVFRDNHSEYAGGLYVIGLYGNVASDPLFCASKNDLTLMKGSPCLPPNSTGCDLIGALGQGCGAVAITAESWGRVKGRYAMDP
jgi:hypothetical protein